MRPQDLLELNPEHQGSRTPPFPLDRLTLLLDRGAALALAVEKWESKGIWVVSRSEETYPSLVRRLGQLAPPLFYGVGDPSLTDHEPGGLAVVGSRHAPAEAIAFTRIVASACAAQNTPVISGGAAGIDSEAVTAALEAGGKAIAVLADRLARTSVSSRYRDAISDGRLLLLSPYDPDAGFHIGNAMGRNKFIYAVASAGLVVHTAENEGGTWAGAIEALKRGTPPVYVRVHGDVPSGNLGLLAAGALAFPPYPWENLAQVLFDGRDDGNESKLSQGVLL